MRNFRCQLGNVQIAHRFKHLFWGLVRRSLWGIIHYLVYFSDLASEAGFTLEWVIGLVRLSGTEDPHGLVPETPRPLCSWSLEGPWQQVSVWPLI